MKGRRSSRAGPGSSSRSRTTSRTTGGRKPRIDTEMVLDRMAALIAERGWEQPGLAALAARSPYDYTKTGQPLRLWRAWEAAIASLCGVGGVAGALPDLKHQHAMELLAALTHPVPVDIWECAAGRDQDDVITLLHRASSVARGEVAPPEGFRATGRPLQRDTPARHPTGLDLIGFYRLRRPADDDPRYSGGTIVRLIRGNDPTRKAGDCGIPGKKAVCRADATSAECVIVPWRDLEEVFRVNANVTRQTVEERLDLTIATTAITLDGQEIGRWHRHRSVQYIVGTATTVTLYTAEFEVAGFVVAKSAKTFTVMREAAVIALTGILKRVPRYLTVKPTEPDPAEEKTP